VLVDLLEEGFCDRGFEWGRCADRERCGLSKRWATDEVPCDAMGGAALRCWLLAPCCPVPWASEQSVLRPSGSSVGVGHRVDGEEREQYGSFWRLGPVSGSWESPRHEGNASGSLPFFCSCFLYARGSRSMAAWDVMVSSLQVPRHGLCARLWAVQAG
jgi:hypothetical protein